MARKEHIKVIGNGNCPFLSPFCPQFGDRIGDKMGTNDFFDYLGTHLFQWEKPDKCGLLAYGQISHCHTQWPLSACLPWNVMQAMCWTSTRYN